MPELNTKLDEAWYHGLFVKYCNYVYAICFQIIREPMLTEDVTQEVFLALTQSLNTLESDAAIKAWLLTVARNKSRTALTKRKNQEARHADLEEHTQLSDGGMADPSKVILEESAVNFIYSKIEGLGKTYADVLLLKFKCNMEMPEIAETLGINLKAAYARYERGRNKLKQQLSELRKGEDGL